MTTTHVVWSHENQDHGTRNAHRLVPSKAVYSLDRDPFNRLPRTARERAAIRWDLAGFGDDLLMLSASEIAELWSGQADADAPTVIDIVWPDDDEADSAPLPTEPRRPKRLSPSKLRRKEARRQAEVKRQAAEKAARRRAQIAQRLAKEMAKARQEAEARLLDADICDDEAYASDDADWPTFGSYEDLGNMHVVFVIPERRSCRGYGPDVDLSDDPFDKELLLWGMHVTARP